MVPGAEHVADADGGGRGDAKGQRHIAELAQSQHNVVRIHLHRACARMCTTL